ncbi:MAG TPA: GGDEF domain-containing protein [Campylobacterales bacterium]|nr:GGDEF domain-containing protein [Campylobacterales bacterium]
MKIISPEQRTEINQYKYISVDELTGLPIRVQLLSDIEQINKSSGNHAHTLMQISIDNYEDINEYFGSDVSNQLLKKLSIYLNEQLPNKKAKLYRFQLDKFAIYSSSRIDLKDLNYYVKKLLHDMSKQKFLDDNNQYNTSISIGVARGRTDLLKKAFLALSDAKKLEKSYTIYNHKSEIEEKFLRNIQIYNDIKDAIADDRIVPFFQPIYNSKINQIDKYEALMRIQNIDGTYKLPGEFLDIAKKTKLYFQLTKKMVQSSLLRAKKLNYAITINLSIEDIENYTISKYIFNRVKKLNIGHMITFEIVETSEINSITKVSNFIQKMRELGCKFAIDDFGSGYSNFEHILRFDVDYIKIDGSLIQNVDTSSKSEIFIKTIINFAKELGIKTVAEFVSNKSIYDKVNSLGVDYVQGFYTGRPKNLLLV